MKQLQILKKHKIKVTFLILIIGSLITLAQVSWLKVSYHHADWLLKREILSTFKLYKPQQKELSHHLDRYHQWHRVHQLPLYINFLGDVAQRLRDLSQRALTPEEVNSYLVRAQSLGEKTVVSLAQEIAPVMVDLNEGQRERTQTLLDRHLDEWRELKKKNKEELIKDLHYSWYENIKHSLGSVNDQQEKILKDYQSRLLIPISWRLAHEGRFNQELLGLFDELATYELDKEKRKRFNEFFLEWQERDDFKPWRITYSKFIAQILNASDEDQVKKAIDHLYRFRELMVELINGDTYF